MYRALGKRILDVLLAGTALILLSPALVVVAVLVRRCLGSPVLFCQVRPGLGGKPFVLYKFRTMRDTRDGQGNLLPDVQRTTRLGRFLRKTSLDELPELWNVLCGSMSLVGPRPLLMEYLERYTPEQARRHEVRPGITGWAQVNGRNALTWEQKLDSDVWYVERSSLWLDLWVLLRTCWVVVSGRGVNFSAQETMPAFVGTQPPPQGDPPGPSAKAAPQAIRTQVPPALAGVRETVRAE
jgi:lipopolysaccharide/colanic/teichoic acid biosynthesis glycosyltransferase